MRQSYLLSNVLRIIKSEHEFPPWLCRSFSFQKHKIEIDALLQPLPELPEARDLTTLTEDEVDDVCQIRQ